MTYEQALHEALIKNMDLDKFTDGWGFGLLGESLAIEDEDASFWFGYHMAVEHRHSEQQLMSGEFHHDNPFA